MIPQAPLPQQPTTNTTQVTSVDQLQDSDISQVVKEAILRSLLQAAISQNNSEGIITGVTMTDAKTARTIFGHNQDTKHFAASINKIPIVLLVLEDLRSGEISLDQIVTWQASDQRGGFGDFDQPGAPMQATLREVLYDMLNKSGNTVVRATVNYILGGPEAVNARFAEKPQLSNTELTVLGPTSFFLGDSTPRDALWAMSELLETQDRPGRFMKDALATNIFTDFGVRSQLADNNNILLVNKIGLLDDPEGNNRHDVGIIYNRRTRKSYGYSFFTTSPFESPTATLRADQSLKDMGKYVLRFAGDSKRGERLPDSLRHLPRAEHRIRY
jgi:beta-lactamase class A